MMRAKWTKVLFLSVVVATGCATTPPPYTGPGPHPQLERGAKVPPIDFLGNVLVFPWKILFLKFRFARHYISPETEAKLIAYLEQEDLPTIKDTKFRLNQYRPGQDLSRLIHNRHVKWPYRLLIGLPVTLLVDVLLPGRLFPIGDYYNPYTNTVHLYSDLASVALHEAGHAHDFATRRFKGTYALARIIPLVDLYQEYKATDEALDYLKAADPWAEVKAYKVLYPAFGSYCGSYIFPPIGTVGGIAVGHVMGRAKAVMQHSYYEKLEAARPQ